MPNDFDPTPIKGAVVRHGHGLPARLATVEFPDSGPRGWSVDWGWHHSRDHGINITDDDRDWRAPLARVFYRYDSSGPDESEMDEFEQDAMETFARARLIAAAPAMLHGLLKASAALAEGNDGAAAVAIELALYAATVSPIPQGALDRSRETEGEDD